MKKFILGLGSGLTIACSSVAFASGSFQALLFPANFEINGIDIGLNHDYKVLNVDGHAYVPIRFIAENLGATIDYDAELQKIFVKNRKLDLTDPDYKGISVGNLILTKAGHNTKVTGQLQMQGTGSSKNMIVANLSFYNDKSEKIGDISIKGNDFGVDSQTFVFEGAGDFRAYSAVNLHIGAVNNQLIPEAPTMLYENTKHQFTLKFPKSWEGKYDAVDNATGVTFIDTANKAYGGVLFSIQIWTKEDWIKKGAEAMGIGRIFKIGENGERVFTLASPGDVEYNLDDQKLTAEYDAMWNHIDTIKTTFKLNNYQLDKLEMVNENIGWAIEKGKKILFTNDGWKTFQVRTPEHLTKQGNIQNFLVINDKSARIFFNPKKGDPLAGYFTNDSGQTWTKQTLSSIQDPDIADVNFIDEKTGWLYTTFNHEVHGPEPHKLYKTVDGGLSWNILDKKGLYTSSYKWVYFMNKTKGWSIGENVKKGTDYIDPTTTALFETLDGGQSWTRNPLIKTKAEQGIDYRSPIFFDGAGMLFAVQYPLNDEDAIGKLFTFQYSLETTQWNLKGTFDFPFKRNVKLDPLPFFKPENIQINFFNINDGWFISNNEVYTTDNGGKSWSKEDGTNSFPSTTNIQFITKNVGFSFNDEALYKTTDGGKNWVRLKAGRF